MKSELSSLNEKARVVTGNYANGKKRGWVWRIAALCFVIVFLGGGSVDREKSAATVDSSQRTEILSTYGKLPIQFIENRQQYPEDVKYYFNSPKGTIYFTSDAVVMQFTQPLSDSADPQRKVKQGIELHQAVAGADREPDSENQSVRGYVIRKQFVGTNPDCQIEGSSALPGTVNFFRGNDPSEWKTKIPTFKELIYHNLYPGIDLVYKGVDGRLKYDLIVYPGADVAQLRFIYEGVDSLQVTESGGLALSVTLNMGNSPCPMHEERNPIIYQEIGGEKILVDGEYRIHEDGSIGFQLFGHDPSFPVVIDPETDLVYSTFLGGGDDEVGWSIAIDESGNVYITGYTSSTNFPVTPGAFDTTYNDGDRDIFVTKLNADGSALIYSTYLGGENDEAGWSIAIDGSGNAYITGETRSTDFPVTPGAFDTTHNGFYDVFVTKLNAAGSALLYSTFLGGGNYEYGLHIAIDGSDNAYITGETRSTDFPVAPGSFDTIHNGGDDVFVTKLNASGSALIYSTFLGGGSTEPFPSIAIDVWGNAYITGWTNSSNFPVTPGAFDTSYNGGEWDGFVTKLNASGSPLLYSTYLGGGNGEGGYAIAIDGSGNVYITGYTYSSDFPVTPGAFDTTYNGNANVFVTRLNTDGSALVYSTFLGGAWNDFGSGIGIDGSGNAYITGYTYSSDFPVTPGAFDTTFSGLDVFVTRLNASGSALIYSTFLGGSESDMGHAIAIDVSGNAYITGYTNSSNFPTTPGAFDTTYNGGSPSYPEDVFVSKIRMVLPRGVQPALWQHYE